jgi:hypothetical protein
MKKITILIAFMAFTVTSVFSQTASLKTNPAMDLKNEITIMVNDLNGLVVELENSVRDQVYHLVQTEPLGIGIIESLKGDGSTLKFEQLNFSKKGSYSFIIVKPDYTTVAFIKVNVVTDKTLLK